MCLINFHFQDHTSAPTHFSEDKPQLLAGIYPKEGHGSASQKTEKTTGFRMIKSLIPPSCQ